VEKILPPNGNEIEEERRLLYVAMTRHVCLAHAVHIPDAITEHFEQCTWPAPIRESSSPAIAARKTVPIGTRLKQMWR